MNDGRYVLRQIGWVESALADRDMAPIQGTRVRPRPAWYSISTRSPDRRNPIGLYRVSIMSIDGLRVRVQDMEALDGTPSWT